MKVERVESVQITLSKSEAERLKDIVGCVTCDDEFSEELSASFEEAGVEDVDIYRVDGESRRVVLR